MRCPDDRRKRISDALKGRRYTGARCTTLTAEHRANIAEGMRKYASAEAKRDARRAQNKASKHRRRGAPGSMPWGFLQALKAEDALCAYCLQPGATEVEHCTPLSRGGRNEPDNVVMACPACNRAKGTQTVLEYMVWA